MTKDSMPVMFSSYKSEKYTTQNADTDKEPCWCCSNNTHIFNSQFKTLDKENNVSRERTSHMNALSGFDSYISDDKKRMFELERQVGYLIQDNK